MTSVLQGNALHVPLGDETVDLIITSPPYFALRSYRDGGEHYDGQIGSEPTPQAFLEALWAVTKECWRCLKPGGSMFVNLGDTRAGSGGPGGDYNADGLKAGRPRSRRQSVGVRSRWTRANAAWLAGVIDCDGSISVRSNAVPEGRSPSFVPWCRIGMTRPEVVDRAFEITGTGQVFRDGRGVYNWNVSAQQARYVLEHIWPWLRIKQRQALAAIAIACHIEDNDNGLRLTPEIIAHRRELRDAVIAWNKGRPCDLVPPPACPIPLPDDEVIGRAKSKRLLPHQYAVGCLTGRADPDGVGWIVRQDIVWDKPNGLPESVTDRVRDSHEYWFHLTKQGDYFAAVDEVREGYAPGTAERYASGYKSNGRAESGLQNQGITRSIAAGELVDGLAANPLGKLPGSVWKIASEPLAVPDYMVEDHTGWRLWDAPAVWQHARLRFEAGDMRPLLVRDIDHFAAFPQEWPRRLILGWSPSGICSACGEGRRPVVAKELVDVVELGDGVGKFTAASLAAHMNRRKRPGDVMMTRSGSTQATITGYACACRDANWCPSCATVIDGVTRTNAGVARRPPADMPGMRDDVLPEVGRLAGAEVLLPEMRGRQHGQEPFDLNGADADGQGLRDAPPQGSPRGEPGRLRDGASSRDGEATRSAPDGGRSGASPQRGKGRPSARESGGADEGDARSLAEDEEADRVPRVRVHREAGARCPHCGGALTVAPTRRSVVLDPFGGTGTVAMVARALGRTGISLDLSADYTRLARWRIFQSGHASKTRERTNRAAQGSLL